MLESIRQFELIADQLVGDGETGSAREAFLRARQSVSRVSVCVCVWLLLASFRVGCCVLPELLILLELLLLLQLSRQAGHLAGQGCHLVLTKQRDGELQSHNKDGALVANSRDEP